MLAWIRPEIAWKWLKVRCKSFLTANLESVTSKTIDLIPIMDTLGTKLNFRPKLAWNWLVTAWKVHMVDGIYALTTNLVSATPKTTFQIYNISMFSDIRNLGNFRPILACNCLKSHFSQMRTQNCWSTHQNASIEKKIIKIHQGFGFLWNWAKIGLKNPMCVVKSNFA